MEKKQKITYSDAGVDVTRGYDAVRLMKDYARSTFDGNVLTGLGSFGGMYRLGEDVLVAGTDGVGTKLKIAFALHKHDTIGIDCVAMCVNDIICHGAKPLFFLDYIATGRIAPETAAEIVKGVAEGCRRAGAALIGGETAEMPGFYPEGEYDVAGCAVGIVKEKDLITGENIAEGDVLIGLSSSGVHSNGYSLVRKVFSAEKAELEKFDETLGCTIGEELLKPTRIYAKTVLAAMEKFTLKGIAHITGGGFHEKLSRLFTKDLYAEVDSASYPLPPVFSMLQERAGLSKDEAYSTFNMGIGMVFVAAREDAAALAAFINEQTEDKAQLIGSVKEGKGGVVIL